jgi:hypothetical protein
VAQALPRCAKICTIISRIYASVYGKFMARELEGPHGTELHASGKKIHPDS